MLANISHYVNIRFVSFLKKEISYIYYIYDIYIKIDIYINYNLLN